MESIDNKMIEEALNKDGKTEVFLPSFSFSHDNKNYLCKGLNVIIEKDNAVPEFPIIISNEKLFFHIRRRYLKDAIEKYQRAIEQTYFEEKEIIKNRKNDNLKIAVYRYKQVDFLTDVIHSF
jgi:hypothetical protein